MDPMSIEFWKGERAKFAAMLGYWESPATTLRCNGVDVTQAEIDRFRRIVAALDREIAMIDLETSGRNPPP